jgi:hypothetical protein
MSSKLLYYTIQTKAGIKFHLQAVNELEARTRAQSPKIAEYLSYMMVRAVKDISTIEAHKGPVRLLQYPVFEDAIFK